MSNRNEIRICGDGGQGIITLGILLAKIFSRAGKNVCQTQNYSNQVRGGICVSDVIFSDDVINYPQIVKPNLIVVLSQQAYDKYCKEVYENIIVDSSKVKYHSCDNCIQRPFSKIAFGKELYANIIVSGFICKQFNLISIDDINNSDMLITNNKKAFNIGYGL